MMTNAELIEALQTDIREVEDDPVNTLSLMWRAAYALEADDEKIADYTAAIDALDDSNDAYIKENERLKKRIEELEDEIKNLENAYIAELKQAHINVQRSAEIYREWYEAVGSKRGKDNESA